MNPHTIQRLFPNASKSLLAANAGDYGEGNTKPVSPAVTPQAVATPPSAEKAPGRRRRVMNKTEAAYKLILNAKVQAGEIVSYEFEGLTLRWGTLDNIQYTPDFAAFRPDGSICMIETKGAHLWKDTTQKFKAARNRWPQFRFEMWQRKKGEWTQLL